MSTSPAARIEKLRKEIEHHNFLYYTENQPQISDREFDHLLKELQELETQHPELIAPDSPTQRVGGAPISGFETVEHKPPMMSIDNTYNEQDLRAFDDRVRRGLRSSEEDDLSNVKVAYVLEPKIDGVAVAIRYDKKGQFELAATRGDGNYGDDITENARTIRSIPLRLRESYAEKLEVRGEVYMTNDEFQCLNKRREEQGEPLFANPRNATAGTLKQLDSRIVAQRRLRFVAHGSADVDSSWREYSEWLRTVRKLGIPTTERAKRVESIEEAIEYLRDFEKVRGTLAYQTDGMVVKVDSFDQRETLGATSKAPKWVIAYKYPAEQVQTVLNDVVWQVGKNGTLTPVAELEPIFVAGTTVKRASLHNIDQIRKLDIHIGDTLVVEKAGEIIPYVRQVVPKKRPKDAKAIHPPRHCPSCHSQIEKEEGTPLLRCANPECPAQLKERLRWFCGRKQMNIEGIGERTIDQLVEEGLVRKYKDLYSLKTEQLASLTHENEMGLKSAKKILESISKAPRETFEDESLFRTRENPLDLKQHLEQFARELKLTGLGEKTIAATVDRGLIRRVDDLFNLRVEDIAALPREVRLGEATASKIIRSIDESKSRGLARVLASIGIHHVGNTVARRVAQWAGNLEKLKKATESELHSAISGKEKAHKERASADEKVAHQLYLKLAKLAPEIQNKVSKASDPENLKDEILALGKDAGIKSMNENRASAIAEAFEDGASLIEATEEQLKRALDPKVVAKSLLTFIHSAEGKRTFEELESAGVKLTERKERTTAVESLVSGKAVVITGSFEVSRDVIAERLEKLGAHVTGSVTSKTGLVLVGKDPGSKLEKANSLGIEIWDEETIKVKLPQLLEP